MPHRRKGKSIKSGYPYIVQKESWQRIYERKKVAVPMSTGVDKTRPLLDTENQAAEIRAVKFSAGEGGVSHKGR